MAARAHAVDALLPRSAGPAPLAAGAERRTAAHLRSDGRRRDVLDGRGARHRGHRSLGTQALRLRGRDYEHDEPAASLSNMKHPMRGCGPFTHDDETDRPPQIFSGKVTLHFERQPYLLLPIIPPK